MFELNKYRGVTFDGTEYWWKIWRKNDLCFQNMRNLAHFHQSMFGSGVFTGEFVSWKWRMMQNLKTKWLVSLKLTWGFDEFWPEHSKKSKICTLMGYFWPKYIIFELEKVIFDGTEYRSKISMKNDLCFLKIFVYRLRNSNFNLESKMAELNWK